MSNASNRLYEFGDYCLDTKEKLLLCQGERIPLTMKAFETLLILVERHGHIVEKAEIIKISARFAKRLVKMGTSNALLKRCRVEDIAFLVKSAK
jgi:DNA-binding response OmpR family regulator